MKIKAKLYLYILLLQQRSNIFISTQIFQNETMTCLKSHLNGNITVQDVKQIYKKKGTYKVNQNILLLSLLFVAVAVFVLSKQRHYKTP